jgi:adenylate cyclase
VPSEIEHKYLVLKEAWTPQTSGVLYRQGYLSSTKERVVRVRIAGDRAYLTVKGPTTGVTRLEFEYPIPINDAATMLQHLCERPLIEKTRYRERVNSSKADAEDPTLIEQVALKAA